MEMRIVIPDAAGATALAEWLTVAFGSERISFGEERPVVDVLINGEPDHAIVRVVDTVERLVRPGPHRNRRDVARGALLQLARWLPAETWY